ncbi:MAG TPA: hypothetical protein DEP45_04700 [Armatimonadetes bacterium]|nr:hypothetical protein [Armatimonadota bacterium]
MVDDQPVQPAPQLEPASRRFEFSVRVPPEMLRRASTYFMWRRLKVPYILGWVATGLGFAVYRSFDLGLLTTAVGVLSLALLLLLVLLPLAIWSAIKQTLKGYAAITGGEPVAYTVDDQWLQSRCANGAGELRWSRFAEVIKTDEVWLLSMATEQRFIPLPARQVPQDALLFIDAEIAAHGTR